MHKKFLRIFTLTLCLFALLSPNTMLGTESAIEIDDVAESSRRTTREAAEDIHGDDEAVRLMCLSENYATLQYAWMIDTGILFLKVGGSIWNGARTAIETQSVESGFTKAMLVWGTIDLVYNFGGPIAKFLFSQTLKCCKHTRLQPYRICPIECD
jgi:hypothetical protein